MVDHDFEPLFNSTADSCGHVAGCGLSRAAHVRLDPIPDPTPDWVPRYETCKGYRGGGSQHIELWEADDAHPPGEEHMHEAWNRIFAVESKVRDWLEGMIDAFDGGDAFYRLYAGNRVTVSSPCGDAIYQYLPARKFA